MTDTVVDFGFTIGDTGPNEGCDGSQGNTIGHDLVVTGNSALSNDFFGPSSIDVDDNNVAHDLVFTTTPPCRAGTSRSPTTASVTTRSARPTARI
jgi:hypothetical protein